MRHSKPFKPQNRCGPFTADVTEGTDHDLTGIALSHVDALHNPIGTPYPVEPFTEQPGSLVRLTEADHMEIPSHSAPPMAGISPESACAEAEWRSNERAD